MTCFISFLFFVFFLSASCSGIHIQTQINHSVPAIYVFGDSTVDPGNNNYIDTIIKSNFTPYGVDLHDHVPTGRFSNGRLTPDFIASYLGIKDMVPPYLNKSLSMEELTTGVSFASAGSGFDPLTAQTSHVIPMDKQLEYFKEYKTRMEELMGKEKAETHICNSGYIISAGTNDFGITYFTFPVRRQRYSLPEYENFLLENTRNFIQGLLFLGARKIAVGGVTPMGCIPSVIAMNSKNVTKDKNGCIMSYNQVAEGYNTKLQQELQSIIKENSDKYDVRIVYTGIYEPLLDIIQNYIKKGFQECRRGCCGTSALEASLFCHPESLVCPDRSKFVFWDSTHPTEKTYYLIFLAARDLIDSMIKP